MSSFNYSPLEGARNIRLVTLLANNDEDGIVECELNTSSLEKHSIVPYEALSYTWGSTEKTTSIKLNGSPFPVTANLERALRALRLRHQARVFWIDQISINQANLQEQGEQVRMMYEIYQSANCVVVWLGLLDRDSEKAMRNMAEKQAQNRLAKRKDWNNQGRTCSCRAGDGSTYPDRTGVQKLLERKWFTRVWVLQEVAAAKKLTITCGNISIPSDDFHHEIMAVAYFYRSMEKTLRRTRPILELMNPERRSAPTDDRTSLIELIENFRAWQATVPVDKIYALLGISSDAASSAVLRPDYNLAPSELARKVIEFSYPEAKCEDSLLRDEGAVRFSARGLILGTVGGKSSGPQGRQWSIDVKSGDGSTLSYSPHVSRIIGSEKGWNIPFTNERRLQPGKLIVLLEGSSRPTILSGNSATGYSVIMLATPEPIEGFVGFQAEGDRQWSSILDSLHSRVDDLVPLNLCWDPFRAAQNEEISSFRPKVNSFRIQWEAILEGIRDSAELGQVQEHDCAAITMLWMKLRADEANIKSGTSQYTTTLHHAAYNGQLGTAKLLLDAGADIDEIHPGTGMSPLHLATSQGHSKLVDELLFAGAEVDLASASGQTALGMAISASANDICFLLLKAGAKASPISGNTYLIFPSIAGNTELVEALITAGANPNATDDLPNIKAIAPIHMAAEMGNEAVVAALLEGGAGVDAKTSESKRALHQAAMNGHVGTIQVLLKAGSDLNDQDHNGLTPLDFALHQNHDAAAKMLQNAGGVINYMAQVQDRDD